MRTRPGNESIAVEVMKTWVQDYLVKDHLTRNNRLKEQKL